VKISRDRGKRFEQRVAKYLCVKRNHFEAEDVGHWLLSIECKYRTTLPRSVLRWMEQAEKACDYESGKHPVVVAGEYGKKVTDSLVIMRLKDLDVLLFLAETE